MDEEPAWSPDGGWIGYWHFNPSLNDQAYPAGLYVVDTNGQDRRLVLAGSAFSPDWSPDGTQIVFANGDIFSINVEGGDLLRHTTTGNSHSPNWSGDGSKMIFTRSGTQDIVGLWVLFVGESYQERLGFGADPDWSPDDERYVYIKDEVFVADADGSNEVQLTSNDFDWNSYPSWSPDGTMIAWTVGYDGTDREDEIWLMGVDGSNQRRLTKGRYPSWSPDSQEIVFSGLTETRDAMTIWIISIDGTNLRQITF